MKTRMIILFVILCITGCNIEQKAVRKMLRLQSKYPGVMAGVCGRLYPPLEYVKDSIAYKPAKLSGMVYVYAHCDSALAQSKKKQNVIMKIPCPKTNVADTVFIYKEKQVVNRADVERLQLRLIEAQVVESRLRTLNRLWQRSSLLLVTYTIVRWLLRLWGIRLP